MKLVPGLYEALVTRDRAAAMRLLEGLVAEARELDDEGAPSVLALHLHRLLVKALRNAPGEDRRAAQVDS